VLVPISVLRNLDLPGAAIEDRIVSRSRWSIEHEIIFEYNSQCYRANYRCGATEYQDENPWDLEDFVDCVPVKKVPVMVEQWVDIDEL
jgi:hypothetical protein